MSSQALKIFNAKEKRTKIVIEKRKFAEALIMEDLGELYNKASKKGYKVAVRLNCFSDLDWREFISKANCTFPEIIFYDYTKVWEYIINKPAGYHLTYSWSGRNEKQCRECLGRGFNVAVPFKKQIPETFLGYPTIDGDTNDLRFLDPSPVVVGLKYKKNKQPKPITILNNNFVQV